MSSLILVSSKSSVFVKNAAPIVACTQPSLKPFPRNRSTKEVFPVAASPGIILVVFS